ncbi:MAG TPA: hypothetical protein VFZ32_19365 [Micromonosporaceae bacterium]
MASPLLCSLPAPALRRAPLRRDESWVLSFWVIAAELLDPGR